MSNIDGYELFEEQIPAGIAGEPAQMLVAKHLKGNNTSCNMVFLTQVKSTIVDKLAGQQITDQAFRHKIGATQRNNPSQAHQRNISNPPAYSGFTESHPQVCQQDAGSKCSVCAEAVDRTRAQQCG
jgi:hypothetical protein